MPCVVAAGLLLGYVRHGKAWRRSRRGVIEAGTVSLLTVLGSGACVACRAEGAGGVEPIAQ